MIDLTSAIKNDKEFSALKECFEKEFSREGNENSRRKRPLVVSV